MKDDGGQAPAFHGRRIIFVSALANAVTMGLGTLNFGLFIQPMEGELGISRAQFGLAGSVRQIAGAVTSQPLGHLIDKHGVRFLLPLSTLIGCGCLILLAFIDAGWQMLLLFALMGLIGLIGPGQLLTSVPVTKWYVLGRPRAIALMSLGVPIGALIFLPLTQVLIESFGWRATWIVLGLLGIVLICPIAYAWMVRAPEDLGQHPDGMDQTAGGTGLVDEHSWTLGAARKTRVFWQLAFAMGMVAFAISTIAVHRMPDFVERGIDPMYVGLGIAWDAVLAGLGTFWFGTLGGRIAVRWVGLLGFALLGVGVVLQIFVTGVVSLFVALSIWGLGIGGMMYVNNIIWADYFGRDHVGAIRGFVMPITLLLGAVGAPIAGYVFDTVGSYDGVWWVSAALFLFAGVVMAASRQPEPAVA